MNVRDIYIKVGRINLNNIWHKNALKEGAKYGPTKNTAFCLIPSEISSAYLCIFKMTFQLVLCSISKNFFLPSAVKN